MMIPLLLRVALLFALPASLAAQTSVFESQVQELRFDNGMRAVLVRTPPVPSRPPRVFIGLYVRYGTSSTHQPELPHLVEHIAANNRPRLVDYVIPAEVTVFGSNAMTRPDYTSLWRTVSPDGVPGFVPHRANRVVGVEKDEQVFQRELGRVTSELTRVRDAITAGGLGAAAALERAFHGDPPSLERRLELLPTYTAAMADAEIDKYYRPDNAVLIVAGDIDPAVAAQVATKHLAGYSARAGPTPKSPEPLIPYDRPVVLVDPRARSLRVGIGFPAPSRTGPDYPAFLILDQLLLGGRSTGGGMSQVERSPDSPLGRRLRGRFGAQEIHDGRAYRDDPPRLAVVSPSYLAVYFEVAASTAQRDIEGGVRDLLGDSFADDLTDAAVAEAKAGLIGFLNAWMLKDDLRPLGDHLAAFTLFDGNARRLNTLPQEISAVAPERVRRLARGYLGRTPFRIGIVSPR